MEAHAPAPAPSSSEFQWCPPEHRDWVDGLRRTSPLSYANIHDAQDESVLQAAPPNSFACPPGTVFSVRAADYPQKKAKIPGQDWLLLPLAFDFLQGPSQIAHIMKHPHSRVRSALDAAILSHPQPQVQQPFVWVFNLQLGNKTNHSLVFYYVSFCSPAQGSLMQRFLDGDDAFRNSRLKAMVCFPEAPWLVRVLVEKRWPVCMVGKFVQCNYTREKNYIEVDVDLATSVLMRTTLRLTAHLFPLVVADIAFVLEGIHPDELPEKILGAVRLVRLNPSSATHIDMSAHAV